LASGALAAGEGSGGGNDPSSFSPGTTVTVGGGTLTCTVAALGWTVTAAALGSTFMAAWLGWTVTAAALGRRRARLDPYRRHRRQHLDEGNYYHALAPRPERQSRRQQQDAPCHEHLDEILMFGISFP